MQPGKEIRRDHPIVLTSASLEVTLKASLVEQRLPATGNRVARDGGGGGGEG